MIELSGPRNPEGSLGIRQYFESPYRPGEKLTLDDYYGWIFEHSVPGLPEAAAVEGLAPLAYMRKYGAFAIPEEAAPVFALNETPLVQDQLASAVTDPETGVVRKDGAAIGVLVDGVA